MLPPLFFILSAWCVLFFTFAGIGLLIRRAFGLKNFSGAEQILDGFWLGWAWTIFFLQAWHLFIPVNLPAFILIFSLGLAGWIVNRQALRTLLSQKGPLKGLEKFVLLIFAGLTFLTAVGASRPASFYDAGLYYIPAVNWTTAYPIIPGLGNLHGRLAFNQSSFLYVGLIEAWSGKAANLANSLLFLALLAEIFISLRNLADRRHQLRAHEIFNILFFPAVWHQTFLSYFSSFAPDQVIFILCVLTASRFLRFLEDAAVDAGQKGFFVFFLVTMATLGITVKATFLIFGGATLAIVFGSLWRARKNKNETGLSKIILWSSVTAAFGISLWFARGIILTGYPAYPAPWAAFPVDWRIPASSVGRMWLAITSYAQTIKGSTPKDVVNFFFIIPCCMAAFGIMATFLKKGWNKKNEALNKKIWPLTVPSVLAALYWYISAPNPRFAMAFFWILGIGLLLQWINGLKNPRFLLVVYMLVSGGFVLAQNKSVLNPSTPFLEAQRESKMLKNFKLNRYKTDSGLNVYVPAQDDRCWYAPLPCTPYPHPGLRLRNPNKIRDGFRIESPEETDTSVGFYSVEPPRNKEIKPARAKARAS